MQQLITNLESISYFVQDAEANIVIPVLIEKTGANNHILKQEFHKIVFEFSKVFPKDKICKMLHNSLTCSKNNRTKVSALEILQQMYNQHTLKITTQKDVINIVQQGVKSSENSVRNAGVSCIGEVYRQIWGKRLASLRKEYHG